MIQDQEAQSLFEKLKKSRLAGAPHWCGADRNPGVDEVLKWRVWTRRKTTPDQRRIEAHLSGVVAPTSSILHIGVGNSSLARQFAKKVSRIQGTTVHIEERILAEELRLPHYEVVVANKYCSEMDNIVGPFDFIVDNNPSSFACCLRHFCLMMTHYAQNLGRRGSILTAQPGLGWATTNNNPIWSLDWDDWQFLGEALGLHSREFPNSVYALQRFPIDT